MSNWHDAMRLTLLRIFGKHQRDVRRLLIRYCETFHASWLRNEYYYSRNYTFHKICKEFANGSKSFSKTAACVYYDQKAYEMFGSDVYKADTIEEHVRDCPYCKGYLFTLF